MGKLPAFHARQRMATSAKPVAGNGQNLLRFACPQARPQVRVDARLPASPLQDAGQPHMHAAGSRPLETASLRAPGTRGHNFRRPGENLAQKPGGKRHGLIELPAVLGRPLINVCDAAFTGNAAFADFGFSQRRFWHGAKHPVDVV